MATPIKETPILTGEDARRFQAAIEANRDKKVPKEDYDRAMETYKRIRRAQGREGPGREDIDKLRGAAESHHENVHAAVYAPHKRFLEED